MSSKAESGVTTEGSKDTSAGGSMRESTMGKEQRWPLEAQQPENVCLGSHQHLDCSTEKLIFNFRPTYF